MPSPTLIAFAQNLVRYRKRRGLSQYALAEKTGLSRRVISHYETHATEPSIEKLEIIAKALGVKVSQLLEESNGIEENSIVDISLVDPRSLRKLKDILSLSVDDRNDLYRMLNKLLRKNQLEREQAEQVEAKRKIDAESQKVG